ncbi:fructose-6-phosphate aldolase [Candidatus Aenigmatarchaeota archaeon]
MKMFIDTANIEEIRKMSHMVCGVTTNPSLISKETSNFKDIILEIIKIVDGPISVEVTAKDPEGMLEQGKEYASWDKNVVIKSPLTGDGLKATKLLSDAGIKVNQTLIFSSNQALIAANCGATYVSPFIGRLDDISQDGIELIKDIVDTFKIQNIKTQVIAASIRHPLHAKQSAISGAHIATIPYKVLEQMIKHPLTDIGVEKFDKDWEKTKSGGRV